MVGTLHFQRYRWMLATLVAALVGLSPLGIDEAQAVGARARTMRSLINQERVSRGRVPLKLNRALSRIARRHTLRMASSNKLYHNPRLAYQARRLRWTVLGENVGVGATVRSLHRAFMNSSGHRANVLNRRYRRVGISGKMARGRLWVTIVFSG